MLELHNPFESSMTVVKCAVGVKDGFKMNVKPYQWSVLTCLFLFVMLTNRLMDEVRQESLWMMTFADDSVIWSEGGQGRETWRDEGMHWKKEE